MTPVSFVKITESYKVSLFTNLLISYDSCESYKVSLITNQLISYDSCNLRQDNGIIQGLSY